MRVFINQIETSVPSNECHSRFLSFLPALIQDPRELKVMQRLASKSQIERRYSVLEIADSSESIDKTGLYRLGDFASTGRRMEIYRERALPLVKAALDKFLPNIAHEITHLIVASCTGFYAPGLDLEIQEHYRLRSHLERTTIGFMGCYAAFNAMKSANHIVKAEPNAKVLIVNVELCTLHMQETSDLQSVLGFMQFADGCAAAVVSAEPTGIEIHRFRNEVLQRESELIQWKIGDSGFEMILSPEVPKALAASLPEVMPRLMSGEERSQMKLWAIHPGGRSILDAVQKQLELRDDEIADSREVLKDFGNMSSATVMFVLKKLMNGKSGLGTAMAFGPGITVESMIFSVGSNK